MKSRYHDYNIMQIRGKTAFLKKRKMTEIWKKKNGEGIKMNNPMVS